MPKKQSAFSLLTQEMGTYLGSLVLSLVLTGFGIIAANLIPKKVGEFIDLLSGQVGSDSLQVGAFFRLLLLLILIALLGQVFSSLLNQKMVQGVTGSLRQKTFDKLLRLPVQKIDSQGHGDLTSRILADTDQVSQGLFIGLSQFFSALLTLLVTLYFMVGMSLRMTSLILVLSPIPLFISRFIAKKSYTSFKDQAKSRGLSTSFSTELIQGLSTIQSYGQEEMMGERAQAYSLALAENYRKATFYSSLTNPMMRFVTNLIYVSLVWMGIRLSMGGHLSLGQVTAFLAYASQFSKPFNDIAGVMTELQGAFAGADRIQEVLAWEEKASDANLPQMVYKEGAIDVEKVHFSYFPGVPILKDITFSVAPGSRVAIVGQTGSGKTTLFNLLMGFFQWESGEIRIDGQDIRQVEEKSLRSIMKIVLQETWLQEGTIRENLCLGREDVSEADLLEVAQACQIDDFISRLPQGYDTPIRSGGQEFSQGQRQLLSIARVMLSNPSILLLDEATSSMDTHTEQAIQLALAKLMRNKTSLIVAHRLSTVKEADQILVMKEGQIVERGTHEELLDLGGYYASLYNM